MKAKKKIYIFYSSHRLKNHFFLSLTPCLCLSPKSLSSHSLSRITLSPCLSFSPKSLLLSQITHHQALILSSQPSQGPKSLTAAPLSPSCSLSLSRFSLLCWLGLIVRSDWWGLIVSWLCYGGFLWLWDRICGLVGRWCCGVTVLWIRGGATAVVVSRLWDRICGLVGRRCCGLWWGDGYCGFVVVIAWVCGGGAVGLGLWRCGCGFGIVEVGCAVGLLQTKEKKSLERKRRTNREMNNKKI